MLRWILILIILGTLAALCKWGASNSPWLLLGEAMEEPVRFDGKTVNQFLYPRIEEIYRDGFLLTERGGRSMRVFCDTTGLIQDKWVGLEAVYHKEGYLIARHVKIAKNRGYKIYLSLLTVIFIAILGIRSFRFDWQTGTIHLRPNA